MAQAIEQGAQANSFKPLNLTAEVYHENDQYAAECIELGSVGQGDTVDEAIESLKDSVISYLQAFPNALSNPRPRTTTYIEQARAMEQAYANQIGEPVEPANIERIGEFSFTISPTHA